MRLSQRSMTGLGGKLKAVSGATIALAAMAIAMRVGKDFFIGACANGFQE